MEECKTLPFPAVWDKLCLDAGVPLGAGWLDKVAEYEQNILIRRC
jgi:L-rhamnose isomerase